MKTLINFERENSGYLINFERAATYRLSVSRVETNLLADSGLSVTLIDRGVEIDPVVYKHAEGVGLMVTDHLDFTLNINEFGAKR